jgi:hypothetical protein
MGPRATAERSSPDSSERIVRRVTSFEDVLATPDDLQPRSGANGVVSIDDSSAYTLRTTR